MSDVQNFSDASPKQILRTLRTIWLALLLGQIALFIVVAVVITNGGVQIGSANDQLVQRLFYLSLAMLLVFVPVGYLLRTTIYKKNWHGDVITPRGYFTGNLLLLALCEGVALFALVVTLLSGTFGLTLLPAVAAMAVQVVNIPTGRPMQPAVPSFGARER